ncbi:MAG: hypothetical protein ACK56Q_01945, partial [Pirellulaceae bacterium]
MEIFDRRRIWIVHHLAMVATGLRWRSSIDVASGSSTIWRLMATGIAVEMYARRRIGIVHHLAMVATGLAVEIFDRRRIWIVHHLAMVATGIAV